LNTGGAELAIGSRFVRTADEAPLFRIDLILEPEQADVLCNVDQENIRLWLVLK